MVIRVKNIMRKPSGRCKGGAYSVTCRERRYFGGWFSWRGGGFEARGGSRRVFSGDG